MRAAVYHGNRDLRLETVPEPDPPPGEVKFRVDFCAICATDIEEYVYGPNFIAHGSPHPVLERDRNAERRDHADVFEPRHGSLEAMNRIGKKLQSFAGDAMPFLRAHGLRARVERQRSTQDTGTAALGRDLELFGRLASLHFARALGSRLRRRRQCVVTLPPAVELGGVGVNRGLFTVTMPVHGKPFGCLPSLDGAHRAAEVGRDLTPRI